MVFELLLALCETIVIEGLMGAFLGISSARFFLCVIVVNILTNIPLNVLILNLQGAEFLPFVVAVLEILIVLIEGLFYHQFFKSYPHPFRLSLILNGVSYFIGLMLNVVV